MGFGTINYIQVLNETLHRGRHSEEYCDYVYNELRDADSVEKLANILNEIRKLLLNGELNL
jgi:hypothetical protein